jgi:hypothetical protein
VSSARAIRRTGLPFADRLADALDELDESVCWYAEAVPREPSLSACVDCGRDIPDLLKGKCDHDEGCKVAAVLDALRAWRDER